MVQQAVKFVQEAYRELRLSTWLSRQQMVQSTIVVLILTLIVSVYVAGIDWILSKVVGFIFRLG